MIKPIETRYKGYRFRSRLEARWAVFFDALGLHWEYEPESFELPNGQRYLPDFKVRYPGRAPNEVHYEWFEVKPDYRISDRDYSKLLQFAEHMDRIIVLDGPPAVGMYPALELSKYIGRDGFETELAAFKDALSEYPEKRHGYALWCDRNRLWWDGAENYFSPTTDFGCYTVIEDAVAAARGARFEFGETP